MQKANTIVIKKNNTIEKLAIVLTLLLGAVYMLGVSAAVEICVGIAFLLVMLILPARISIKYLMFILVANEMLNFGSTSLMMIFVVLFTAIHCFRTIKEIKINAGLFCGVSALLVSSAASTVVAGNTGALLATIKHLFFVYYLAVVLDKSRGEWDRIYVESFSNMAAGVLYFGALAILTSGIPSLTKRFAFSAEISINFSAIVCVLSIVNLVYIKLFSSQKSKRTTILILGCAFFGLLTQSRSFILGVSIGLLLLFLFTSSWIQKFKFMAVGVFCLIAGVVLIMNTSFFQKAIELALGRILNPRNNDISNGRYYLWSVTIAVMMKSAGMRWFGAGDYQAIGAVFDDKILVAHNLFLETWVIYGFIGCAALILLYVFFLKKYVFAGKKLRFNVVSVVPLITMMACMFFSHHFIGRSMSIVFGLSFLPLVMDRSHKNGGKA